MNKRPLIVLGLLIITLLMYSCAVFKAQPHPIWVSAYYAGWMQGCGSSGHLSPKQIDLDAVTHIIHFSVLPNPDGTIDDSTKCISPENSLAITTETHARQKKILISIGGWLSEQRFLEATNDVNRTKFIENLIYLMRSRGYDGIDIDWEPLSSSSTARYSRFIIELRNELNKITPHPLLTAAVKREPLTFAKLQDNFDQINIMTYSLSGPRTGWISWHNAAIHNGGRSFPSGSRQLPSADIMIEDFISAGVRKDKLGIGIAFFGYVWSGGEGTSSGGVTAPGQGWTIAPAAKEMPYNKIMDNYFLPEYYRWDASAKAAYLSINKDGSLNDKFISFDNERACREKIKFVTKNRLGGVIVFELGGGWRPGTPVPDSLLKTIKEAVPIIPKQKPSGK